MRKNCALCGKLIYLDSMIINISFGVRLVLLAWQNEVS